MERAARCSVRRRGDSKQQTEEEDEHMSLLTPNALLFARERILPEPADHRIKNTDLRKTAKYLRRCRDTVWKSWMAEYVRALRERYNLKHNGKQATYK